VPKFNGRLTTFVRTGRRVAIYFIAAYALMLAYLYFNQTSLIFPGANEAPIAATNMARLPNGARLLYLTTPNGERIACLTGTALNPDGTPAPDVARRPTLLYFYGNGGAIMYELGQLDSLRREGLNVYIPDYLGYGLSGGRPSETGCYAVADAVYRYVTQTTRVDVRQVVIAGWSLGSAVAIDLASRTQPAGLIACSAFTSMAEMGSHQYPIVPVFLLRLMLKYPFLSEAKIARVHCPIFIAHSWKDTLVPYAMSRRLEAAAGGPILARFDVKSGDHSSLFDVGGHALYDAIGRFANQVVDDHRISPPN
jgi:fermentation-respiration switch protein FrsA (DUF1100 family)